MALGHLCPERVRLGRGEEIQVDGVPCRRDRGKDVMAVHALSAGHAHRGDGERLQSRCEEANGAVVAGVLVHGSLGVADRSTPAGQRLLPAGEKSVYKFLKKDSPREAIFRLERMRRLSVVLLAVAVAASTAGAAHGAVAKTSGAVYLQLSEGAGLAKIRNRGTLFGQVKRGRIIATRNVSLNGCESKRNVGGNKVRCKGQAITFNTVGADRWRVRLRGRGIYSSGFVRGCLVLNGRDSGSAGTFRRGIGDDADPWPRSRTSYRLGTGSC
jgi:hypothetical protein